jgi:hypothetical protein
MARSSGLQSNKIRYLEGTRLKNAIQACISHLERHQDYLNRIIVFPVPDGDTGTNMFLTMRHVSAGLADLHDRSVANVSSRLANFALMAGFLCLVIFAAVLLTVRIVSVSSMSAAVSLPIVILIMKGVMKNSISNELFYFSILAAFLILFTHRSNIKRLLKGEEKRFRRTGPAE